MADRSARRRKPKPVRPLGSIGRDAWDRICGPAAPWIEHSVDVELLQIVCEQIDERASLRITVLRDGDARDRAALRALDQQITTGLSLLGLTPTDRQKSGLDRKTDDDATLTAFLQQLSTPIRNS